ncbi:hypothetical protein MLD38_002085 [Melastoma candidum]|uniref:Uncharacterized protein n=1 Tax=Melastoma candidum TaxID=119954 RepID=A0ACB9SGX0_9MYRT|nr:hypothetical protein MLD38_002085 [Melastoma candidum]
MKQTYMMPSLGPSSYLSLFRPRVHLLLILPADRFSTRPRHHDVFINHRGVDTKRNVAGLIYHHLASLRLRPFLDCYSMKPGDSLRHEIGEAILGCKVGVAVFSPRYCESVSCLRELALLLEAEKKMIPIFCDVKPSQLQIVDINGRFSGCSDEERLKFELALDEATGILGLSFDSSKGDWSMLLKDVGDAITKYI